MYIYTSNSCIHSIRGIPDILFYVYVIFFFVIHLHCLQHFTFYDIVTFTQLYNKNAKLYLIFVSC